MTLFTVLEALWNSDLNVQRREQNISLTRSLFKKVGRAWLKQWWYKCPKVSDAKGQQASVLTCASDFLLWKPHLLTF